MFIYKSRILIYRESEIGPMVYQEAVTYGLSGS
mgnify:CR=1 FL=1